MATTDTGGLLGKLGAVQVDTGVKVDSSSILNIGIMIFVAACAVLIAIYTYKKIV